MERKTTRPNIVLILADQLRADHVGFGGNNLVQTPSLDDLAKRSAVFAEAYVASPICMPSRASMLTGQMPSTHGTISNGIPLDPNVSTFPALLRRAGYRTALFGKGHLQNMGKHSEAAIRLVDHSVEGDSYKCGQDGWDTWELESRYDDPTREHTVPAGWYGFDIAKFATYHADQCGGHYRKWLRTQGVDPATTQGPTFASARGTGWEQVYKPALPPDLYPSSWVADEAIGFLREVRDSNTPFFIQVSFPDPHHPFTPPGAYWDMYKGADVPLPRSFETGAGRGPHLQEAYDCRGRQPSPSPQSRWSPTSEQFRECVVAEYGQISLLDACIGRIIKALRTNNQLTNTIIVFTSDHGDMFGDHCMMLKTGMHYRGVIRVPLIVSGPGVKAGPRYDLVSGIDLCPTILDLCGVRHSFGVQGLSLRGALTAGKSVDRAALLIEEEAARMGSFGLPSGFLSMRTVLTSSYRLTRYEGSKFAELFQVREDPDENHNRYAEDPILRREAEEVLMQSMMKYSPRRRQLAGYMA